MKARPILFSAAMISALSEGRKSQTRRLIKPAPIEHDFGVGGILPALTGSLVCNGVEAIGCDVASDSMHYVNCPYGKTGDLLWVRETFQPLYADGFDYDSDPAPDYKTGYGYRIHYVAEHGSVEWIDCEDNITDRCKPGIHMPRWASRLTLRITDVRVQRLQEISEEDALAEGVLGTASRESVHFDPSQEHTARERFSLLWACINGSDSWATNPWIWAISFDVIKANIDRVIADASAPPPPPNPQRGDQHTP